jgi:membrane protein DedA with SNARE-associated domain
MHDLFAAIASWITSTVQTGGYVGVAFLTLLENLFPPIPSELILPVAGFLVSSGEMSYVWVVVASTIGSLLGALLLYGIGAWLGEERLRSFVQAHGKWLALDEDDLDQAKGWFEKHGGMAVFIGRLVPSLRSLISVPAGLARMPLGRFVLYTTAGSAVWNAILVGGGWALGGQWERVKPYMTVFEWATVAFLVGSVVWWFVRKRRKGSKASHESASASA